MNRAISSYLNRWTQPRILILALIRYEAQEAYFTRTFLNSCMGWDCSKERSRFGWYLEGNSLPIRVVAETQNIRQTSGEAKLSAIRII